MSEDAIVANVRRRVCQIMNKQRVHFMVTPMYDDFLEQREDLIRKFVELHTSANQNAQEAATLRDQLNKQLQAYEQANDEQILATRSVEEERKRDEIKRIVDSEGLFYERVNADYAHRDLVMSHPLEVQQTMNSNAAANGKPVERKTRVMLNTGNAQKPAPSTLSYAEIIGCTLEASGVAGLWQKKVLKQLEDLNRKLLNNQTIT
jgi:hypothetical protein